MIPDLVKLGPRISASAALSGPFDTTAAADLAACVLRIAAETDGGEGNFQFCGAFNVPPGIPFFPAAYHKGPPSFAIGCETSALLAHAMPLAQGDLARARELIIATFEAQMAPLEAIAKDLSALHDLVSGSHTHHPVAGGLRG